MKRYILILLLAIGGLGVFSDASLAASKIEIPPWAKQSQSGKADAANITSNLANVMYIFAGGIAILGIITGGLLIMNDESDQGWKRLKNTAMGGGIVILAGMITQAFS